MNALVNVSKFIVPRKILQDTERGLRPFSHKEVEGRVLWYGRYDSPATFRFTTAVVPEQDCTMVETVVEHDEILRQSKMAVERHEELGAQVHTHPGAAYHSATDNAEPIIREVGGLSIVIPDFCNVLLTNLDHCAIFQITPTGWCGPWTPDKVARTIVIPGSRPR